MLKLLIRYNHYVRNDSKFPDILNKNKNYSFLNNSGQLFIYSIFFIRFFKKFVQFYIIIIISININKVKIINKLVFSF